MQIRKEHASCATLDRRACRRVMMLGVPLTALILLGAAFSSAALAQANLAPHAQPQPRVEPGARMQAPIGHRQPRPQDLPPSVLRNEGRPAADEKALDKNLEICRSC
jgi:hypothetical protein